MRPGDRVNPWGIVPVHVGIEARLLGASPRAGLFGELRSSRLMVEGDWGGVVCCLTKASLNRSGLAANNDSGPRKWLAGRPEPTLCARQESKAVIASGR